MAKGVLNTLTGGLADTVTGAGPESEQQRLAREAEERRQAELALSQEQRQDMVEEMFEANAAETLARMQERQEVRDFVSPVHC